MAQKGSERRQRHPRHPKNPSNLGRKQILRTEQMDEPQARRRSEGQLRETIGIKSSEKNESGPGRRQPRNVWAELNGGG
jgi:hypothetical protein